VGVVAAMGVAFGAISTFLATVFTKVVDLAPWQITLVVVGIFVVISGPSVLIAWLKLRKRNLGPILDANGWAVNAKAKMNVPFGKSLTHVASLPPGAQYDSSDPFAEKKQPWGKIIVVLIVLFLIYKTLLALQVMEPIPDQIRRWRQERSQPAPTVQVAAPVGVVTTSTNATPAGVVTVSTNVTPGK
jgi:hypothetical protein